MAKKRGMIELPTYLEPVGELKPIEPVGPVAPITSYGKTRGYLQDGRWLPSWFVWLRRRKFGLALALLAVVGVGYGLARVIGGAK